MGLIWDKRHNVYVEESKLEAEARAKRARNAIRMMEVELEAMEANKKRRGFCPKCRLLLPESGRCGCGYQKDTSGMQNVYKGYVNPAILATYK